MLLFNSSQLMFFFFLKRHNFSIFREDVVTSSTTGFHQDLRENILYMHMGTICSCAFLRHPVFASILFCIQAAFSDDSPWISFCKFVSLFMENCCLVQCFFHLQGISMKHKEFDSSSNCGVEIGLFLLCWNPVLHFCAVVPPFMPLLLLN